MHIFKLWTQFKPCSCVIAATRELRWRTQLCALPVDPCCVVLRLYAGSRQTDALIVFARPLSHGRQVSTLANNSVVLIVLAVASDWKRLQVLSGCCSADFGAQKCDAKLSRHDSSHSLCEAMLYPHLVETSHVMTIWWHETRTIVPEGRPCSSLFMVILSVMLLPRNDQLDESILTRHNDSQRASTRRR